MIAIETEKEKEVLENIRLVEDPDIGISLVELGLVYALKVEDKKASIVMTLTSMACPSGPQMKAELEEHALQVEGIEEAEVEVVWSPKWDPREMASEEAKMHLGIFD